MRLIMSLDKYCNEIKFDNSKKNKDQFLTRDELIQNNLRLVVKIAHQYKQYAPIEDLIQECNIGLIKAADRIDRTKKNKFITYQKSYPFYLLPKDLKKINFLPSQTVIVFMKKDEELFNYLKTESTVVLDIVRDGQNMTFKYNIK